MTSASFASHPTIPSSSLRSANAASTARTRSTRGAGGASAGELGGVLDVGGPAVLALPDRGDRGGSRRFGLGGSVQAALKPFMRGPFLTGSCPTDGRGFYGMQVSQRGRVGVFVWVLKAHCVVVSVHCGNHSQGLTIEVAVGSKQPARSKQPPPIAPVARS